MNRAQELTSRALNLASTPYEQSKASPLPSPSDEADRYHEMYWGRSPEYSQTVSVWGRNLTPVRVQSILLAHGLGVDDLLGDTHDPVLAGATELPETVDAALLYAWLGY